MFLMRGKFWAFFAPSDSIHNFWGEHAAYVQLHAIIVTLTITKHIYWLTVNYNEHMAKWNNKKSIHQKERERMDDKLTYVHKQCVT